MSSIFVDSVEAVQQLLKDIGGSTIQPPLLFLDLEGVNLSRHGSISILQLLVPPTGNVYIVDVHSLNHKAFSTQTPDGTTLKTILESSNIPKVFFDVRNDSDALFHHFQVNLQSIIDVQLLEFATRRVPGKFLRGLSKCIEESADLTMDETRQWQKVKTAGLKRFAPEKGGEYEAFHVRPLPADLLSYCVQDVVLLPRLLLHFTKTLSKDSASKVHSETLKRVRESQSASYQSHGAHKALGPKWARRWASWISYLGDAEQE